MSSISASKVCLGLWSNRASSAGRYRGDWLIADDGEMADGYEIDRIGWACLGLVGDERRVFNGDLAECLEKVDGVDGSVLRVDAESREVDEYP